MMEPTNKPNKIPANTPSNWRKNAEYRKDNKWLRYSSQIARRILALIENDEELNQAKLAESIHVSPQQISKIVQGRENLTLETIYKLSQALRVELISFPPYKYSIPLPQLISISVKNENEMELYENELHLIAWNPKSKHNKNAELLSSIKELKMSQMLPLEATSRTVES